MPIYAYACTTCRHAFDFLSRDGKPASACPRCGATTIEKQFAPFGIAQAAASPPCGMNRGAGGCPGAGGPYCERFS